MKKASPWTLRPWLLALVLATTGSATGLSMRAEAQTLRPATPPARIATLVQPAPTQPSSRDLAPGSQFKDCMYCPNMVVVPAGEFLMGSPASEAGRDLNEGPQRLVRVSSFAVMTHEVTQREWSWCVEDGACQEAANLGAAFDEGWGMTRAVVNVSLEDTIAYRNWLRRISGEEYRLLEEAEWEYAARAGTTTPWPSGNSLRADDANFAATGHGRPGGIFPANAFGLYNMHGNVWEWVSDCYEPQTTRPTCPDLRYVVRGGSFADEATDLRSASRRAWHSASRLRNVGFRLARPHSSNPLDSRWLRRAPASTDPTQP